MKILFVLDNVSKSLGIEWLVEGLLKNNFQLTFVLIDANGSEMSSFLERNKIPVVHLKCSSKIELVFNIFKLIKLIRSVNPNVIHTHLRKADIIGQTAAFLCRVKKRVYTRHSSTYNHIYHKKSVLIDKVINFLATDIIAISIVVREVLEKKESVHPKKITLIHHGFDLKSFRNVSCERVEKIRQKHQLESNKTVIGVIARYTEWKGYQYIIPAFAELYKKDQNIHFVFANTGGAYTTTIHGLFKKFLPNNSYTEIKFENDIQALYYVFNFYVHTPIDDSVEAFGQTYIEALASGVPSIFTLSGVANEFIINERNAMVVSYQNSIDVYEKLIRLLGDISLRNQLVKNGRDDVEKFALDPYTKKMINFYNAVLR